jgi:hypothetical protein
MTQSANRPYRNVSVSFNALNGTHDVEIGFLDEIKKVTSNICFFNRKIISQEFSKWHGVHN